MKYHNAGSTHICRGISSAPRSARIFAAICIFKTFLRTERKVGLIEATCVYVTQKWLTIPLWLTLLQAWKGYKDWGIRKNGQELVAVKKTWKDKYKIVDKMACHSYTRPSNNTQRRGYKQVNSRLLLWTMSNRLKKCGIYLTGLTNMLL
jgi:hypothetical protein